MLGEGGQNQAGGGSLLSLCCHPLSASRQQGGEAIPKPAPTPAEEQSQSQGRLFSASARACWEATDIPTEGPNLPQPAGEANN